MDDFQLDYSDVIDIFKEKLRIGNTVKSIDNIFNNSRYFEHINYKPYFQRNYVWDDEKATYFIESILLGTEIPPIVLFQTKQDNEVIDGRQRFETICRFLKDKLTLRSKGLKSLSSLSGKKFSQLDEQIREGFLDTRIRILQFEVVNEPRLSDEKEDKIKKEIFRRYNSGITPLQKFDIDTAMFIDDALTNLLKKEIEENIKLFDFLCKIILPRSKKKANKRDKVNVLLTEIREIISLEYIPIYEYARSSKTEMVKRSYFANVASNDANKELERFNETMHFMILFYNGIIESSLYIKSMQLFFACIYWGIRICLKKNVVIREDDILKICNKIQSGESKLWNRIINQPIHDYSLLFEQTGSHYYASIMNRFTFISNVLGDFYKYDFSLFIRDRNFKKHSSSLDEYHKYKINKALPETLSIEDIIRDISRSKFLIRPNYQRSEVKNTVKASYLMESVLLGIKIPPLFVYKRKDNVKEVVDGQQRLLTLLGYLGEPYIDENGAQLYSDKNRFKLKELKILKELKGKDVDGLSSEFKDKILDFQMDVIEIDGNQNPDFKAIDLFLRLNTKPYPIKDNTFEMWNAYLDKRIIIKAKELTEKYEGKVFRPRETRMKVEELITSLAYIDYKIKRGVNISSVLCVFVKDERLCARLMSKAQMTKQLNEISVKNPEAFIKSLDNVALFAEKLLFLTNGEKESMKQMVSHLRKRVAFKTDQNFYCLWFLLKDIEIDFILEHKHVVFERIRNKFNEFQNFKKTLNKEKFNELFSISLNDI